MRVLTFLPQAATAIVLAGGALVAVSTPAGAAPTRAHHTVSWYVANPTARQNVLRQCDNDRSLDNNGDCRNATAAAAQTAVPGTANGTDAFAAENTVAAYKTNAMLRDMVLSSCKTNRPAPAAWCKAAGEAQREVDKQ